jgi:hypothetical protein
MKEDDEGIPFHTLRTVEMHRGDRILRRKSQRLFCSSVLDDWRLFSVPGGAGLRQGATGGERMAAGEGRSRGGAGGEGTHRMQAVQGFGGGCVAETQEDAGRGQRCWARLEHAGGRAWEDLQGAVPGDVWQQGNRGAGGDTGRAMSETCGAAGETHVRRWLRRGARGSGRENRSREDAA